MAGKTASVAVAGVVGLALLGGCAGSGVSAPSTSTAPTSADSSPAATSPTQTAHTSPAGQVTVSPSSPAVSSAAPKPTAQPASVSTAPIVVDKGRTSEDLRVQAVRVGEHDGYSRFFIEFAGGAPDQLSYEVRYVKNPTTQGKGDAIDVGSPTVAMVRLLNMPYPPSGTPLPQLGRQPGTGGGITGYYCEGAFEGYQPFHVGLTSVRALAVTTLADPTRLVVDFVDN